MFCRHRVPFRDTRRTISDGCIVLRSGSVQELSSQSKSFTLIPTSGSGAARHESSCRPPSGGRCCMRCGGSSAASAWPCRLSEGARRGRRGGPAARPAASPHWRYQFDARHGRQTFVRKQTWTRGPTMSIATCPLSHNLGRWASASQSTTMGPALPLLVYSVHKQQSSKPRAPTRLYTALTIATATALATCRAPFASLGSASFHCGPGGASDPSSLRSPSLLHSAASARRAMLLRCAFRQPGSPLAGRHGGQVGRRTRVQRRRGCRYGRLSWRRWGCAGNAGAVMTTSRDQQRGGEKAQGKSKTSGATAEVPCGVPSRVFVCHAMPTRPPRPKPLVSWHIAVSSASPVNKWCEVSVRSCSFWLGVLRPGLFPRRRCLEVPWFARPSV